jgi:hypothetical protein
LDFGKYLKQHNNGHNTRFIRAAGTRMAGQAITMIRFLRLKNALLSAINLPEFTKLKVRKPFIFWLTHFWLKLTFFCCSGSLQTIEKWEVVGRHESGSQSNISLLATSPVGR